MLLKKSIFFLLILLLDSISVHSSPENQQVSRNTERGRPLTEGERDKILKVFLSSYEKPATQDLIKDIVELTDGYTITQVTELLIDIISTSKGNIFEQSNCLEKLEKAINRIDKDQIRQLKLNRLKEIVYKPFKRFPFNFKSSLKKDIDLYDADAVFPTADKRFKIVKEVLLEHKKSASKFLMHSIVEQTSGFEMSYFRDLITHMVKESKSSSLDQEKYLQCPTKDERHEVVKEVLLLTEKSAPESLVQDIAELTELYDIYTVKNLACSLVEKSKTNSLDRNSCIAILKKVIDSIDKDEVKKFKLAQIEAMTARESLSKLAEQKTITTSRKEKKYPLLNDMYHHKMILFQDAATQLRAGKFKKGLRAGMLLYGPPGVGKTTMVKAMANESNCQLFQINGSEVVNGYKGSGAGSIKEVFAKAKAVEADKGVIVFVDELERLSPRTTDKNVQFAFQYEGQEEGDGLTQIWIEHDECAENHSNILVVAATNKFEVVDKRIRDRFRSIRFSCPEHTDAYKILKNKAQQHNVPLSKAELQYHAKRMKGLSGRELATFIEDISGYIEKSISKEKALELVVEEQKENKKMAKSKTPNRKIERAKDQVQDLFIQKVMDEGGSLSVDEETGEIERAPLTAGETFLNLSKKFHRH